MTEFLFIHIVYINLPLTGDYDQANQYISDYTTGVSAAEDSITYSMTDPAVVELPEKRKRKNKLCDESDINSETSSCEGLHILKWLVCIKQFSHNSVIILYLYVLNRWYELEAVRKWSEAIWSEVKKCPTAQTSYIPWLACFNFDVELWTC